MKTLLTAVVLATLAASPALSQPFGPGRLDRPFIGHNGQIEISAARAAALRQCNERAARATQYRAYEWGNTYSYIYRACMTEHRQVE